MKGVVKGVVKRMGEGSGEGDACMLHFRSPVSSLLIIFAGSATLLIETAGEVKGRGLGPSTGERGLRGVERW